MQLITRPLGYQLKRSSISITAELQAVLWLLVFLEHLGIKGLKLRVQIIPNRQVVAGCQERTKATKAIASFLHHNRTNVTLENTTQENNSVSFQTFTLITERKSHRTLNLLLTLLMMKKMKAKKELFKKPGKPKHFSGEKSR